MVRIAIVALASIRVAMASGQAAPVVTQADLLRRLVDFDRLMLAAPAGEQAQFFSAPQLLPADAQGWSLAADLEGPGALTGIWISDSSQASVRIDVDGATALEARVSAVQRGDEAPFGPPFSSATPAGGLWARFPVGFDRQARVWLRDMKGPYGVSAVRFAADVRVAPFRRELDDEARQVALDIGKILEESQPATMPADPAELLHSPVEDYVLRQRRTYSVASQRNLAAGEALKESLEKAGVVRALYVALTDRSNPRALYALHRCLIRIRSDGRQTPDVECPLIDFFGAAFDYSGFNSVPMGTQRYLNVPLPDRRVGQDYYFYCYYPMPFVNGATIELYNGSEEAIGVMLYLRVDRSAPPEGALRFRAGFRREDPCRGAEFVAGDLVGRGRLVGCTLGVHCPREAWWGGGGVRATIDRGTAMQIAADTAAYFGDGPGLHLGTSALTGVTRQSSYGKSAAFRWHISDDIPFQRSLRLGFTNRQAEGRQDVFYSAVIYWYGGPDDAGPRPLRAEELALPPLRIPDAVEIEGRVSGNDWGAILSQKSVPDLELSGGGAVSLKENVKVVVGLQVKAAGDYALKLRVRPRRPFGAIEVSDAGGAVLGRANYARTSDGIYEIGVVRLQEGLNELGVRSDASVVLDCWILKPK